MTSPGGVDAQASAFASRFGSFALMFDAAENYGGREPCPLPWSVMLDGDPGRGWGGHTAEDALDEAATGLAGTAGP